MPQNGRISQSSSLRLHGNRVLLKEYCQDSELTVGIPSGLDPFVEGAELVGVSSFGIVDRRIAPLLWLA